MDFNKSDLWRIYDLLSDEQKDGLCSLYGVPRVPFEQELNTPGDMNLAPDTSQIAMRRIVRWLVRWAFDHDAIVLRG